MSDQKENRPSRKKRTPGPTREGDSLADVVELLLDKGVVINADIAVSVGETELLGIHIRAAIASFETAAKYGLQFPDGTDAQRIEEASGRTPLEEGDDVGDGAPISVRSPSRRGVSGRPGDEDAGDEDAGDDAPAEAGEEGAETVAEESSGETASGESDGDEASGSDDAGSDDDARDDGSDDDAEAEEPTTTDEDERTADER